MFQLMKIVKKKYVIILNLRMRYIKFEKKMLFLRDTKRQIRIILALDLLYFLKIPHLYQFAKLYIKELPKIPSNFSPLSL